MALVVNTYGGTTWIQHTGYVLRGASSGVVSRNATATGGSDTITPSGTVGGHTLTNSEIPSHNHGTANSGGSFLSAGVSGSNIQLGGTGTFGGIAINGSTASTGGGGSHSHGLTMNSHTNLPSYKSVYIWERTA